MNNRVPGMRTAITRISVLCALPLSAVLFLLVTPGAASANTESDHAAFIAMAGKAAKASQQKYGVPASVTVAQAILESNWGTSELAKKTKNHFGMKCDKNIFGPIASGCAESPTWECEPTKGCYDTTAIFRVYKSVADSFSDHGNKLHLSARYKNAFKYTGDADQFIREVHKAGYATDPKYSDKVIKLMKQYNLYKFDTQTKKARVQQLKQTVWRAGTASEL